MAEAGSMKLGAIASPRHKLAAAAPHVAVDAPSQFCRLATQLSFWLNNVDGICVTAEEAAAKSADGIFIDDKTVGAWARKHGWLNGASLTDVMDAMISEGITFNGSTYKDGPYQSIDWTDYPTLCSAIYQGQAKIGVAAGQIESAATPGTNGWFMPKARHSSAIDHCVGLAGYGPLSYCAEQLKANIPAGYDLTMPCLIMFTWDSYGIVSHDANAAVCGEAWLRTPTTPGISPSPDPGPAPQINPLLAVPGASYIAVASTRAATLPCPYYGCYDANGNPMWDDVKFPPEKKLR